MKHTLPKNNSHTRHNRFDLLASLAKGAGWFALSRVPANYRWQAHGEGRSFHQAPHALHVSRTPKGR